MAMVSNFAHVVPQVLTHVPKFWEPREDSALNCSPRRCAVPGIAGLSKVSGLVEPSRDSTASLPSRKPLASFAPLAQFPQSSCKQTPLLKTVAAEELLIQQLHDVVSAVEICASNGRRSHSRKIERAKGLISMAEKKLMEDGCGSEALYEMLKNLYASVTALASPSSARFETARVASGSYDEYLFGDPWEDCEDVLREDLAEWYAEVVGTATAAPSALVAAEPPQRVARLKNVPTKDLLGACWKNLPHSARGLHQLSSASNISTASLASGMSPRSSLSSFCSTPSSHASLTSTPRSSAAISVTSSPPCSWGMLSSRSIAEKIDKEHLADPQDENAWEIEFLQRCGM